MKTYTEKEVKQEKWEVLHELFLRIKEEHTKALEKAYRNGELNVVAVERARAYGDVLATIVGFQNNL